jgi:hypothetical protein
MLATQQTLGMRLRLKPVLMTLEAVRIALAVDADTVIEQAQNGGFNWVWDISASPKEKVRKISELRFWFDEIQDAAAVAGLELADVVARIASPNREWYRATELEQMLITSGTTIAKLAAELRAEVVGHTRRIPRAALADFLTRRHVGSRNI